MRRLFLPQKEIITAMFAGAALLFSSLAGAQNADISGMPPADYVVPPPRTITAELPVNAPEKLAELYWHDDRNQVCVDSFRLSLSRIHIVKNSPVSARMRLSRKCNERAVNMTVPVSATLSTRAGQKSGPSETIRPDSGSFAFNITFPSAGNWTVTVVCKFEDGQTHTVSVPVKVLAELPGQTPQ